MRWGRWVVFTTEEVEGPRDTRGFVMELQTYRTGWLPPLPCITRVALSDCPSFSAGEASHDAGGLVRFLAPFGASGSAHGKGERVRPCA